VDGEPESLARGIRELLGDDARRTAMGEAGRSVASSEFSWDSIARRMLGHYRGIAAGVGHTTGAAEGANR
jgi:glycosyltransferase involved in cell wall biosynthesis